MHHPPHPAAGLPLAIATMGGRQGQVLVGAGSRRQRFLSEGLSIRLFA
eukprot:CAMPEP_0206617864 /NCGR_PEP_ID=MMETSP0325_2-20121206/59882_1 /ASSEMBLY_ACC=CAM_ASM_000347 /TAXON_ID=2866 /ORGANISM="Crypthecodinium cohnii, Strain Seligo" /LENGTH=47 /DNA_ID= /DNA_START= /DNA_END= /DNA_ORIENTATION=